MLWQIPGGTHDGLHELVHCGVVIRNCAGLALLEAMPGCGVRIVDIAQRVREYKGAVLHCPLSELYHAQFADMSVQAWLELHRRDKYRWGGLPLATALFLIGGASPGALFCSELVASLYAHLGILPDELPVLRGNRITGMRLEPQLYSPSEIARLPQLKRSKYAVL